MPGRARLAELTCSAYERDVRACLRFLQASGIRNWAEVRPPELRRFLAAETERRQDEVIDVTFSDRP